MLEEYFLQTGALLGVPSCWGGSGLADVSVGFSAVLIGGNSESVTFFSSGAALRPSEYWVSLLVEPLSSGCAGTLAANTAFDRQSTGAGSSAAFVCHAPSLRCQ